MNPTTPPPVVDPAAELGETATPPQEAPATQRGGLRGRWRIALASALSALLLLGIPAWWALDRFLIPHVTVTDVEAYEAAAESSSASTSSSAADDAGAASDASAAVVTDTSYTSDTVSIDITTHTQGSGSELVTYYVAEVELTDATDLQRGFANNQFGENVTALVSDIAAENDAVFAINGDYYGFRDTGIAIRNGVVYRDDGAREGLAFYRDGSLAVYDETTTTCEELVAEGVWSTVSFGPTLVEDGAIVSGIDDVEVDTNFGNHSIQGEQPRSAVGITADGTYLFVVVDGRETGYSRGVTMTELAQIMTDLGAVTAYNLDGGGSAEMWFNGRVVNQPSNGGERATSDILYIAG